MKNKYARLLIPQSFLFLLGGIFHPISGQDDVYLIYWPVRTLANKGQLLNLNGEFVEQATSLAYVLVLSIFEIVFPFSLELIGPLISVLFGSLTCYLLVRFVHGFRSDYALWAGLLLVTSLYFNFWSYSGMEMTFQAFLTLLLVVRLDRVFRNELNVFSRQVLPLIVVFLLIRPESVILLFCVLAGAYVLERYRRIMGYEGEDSYFDAGTIVRLTIATLIIFGTIVTFRLYYFGSIFPQPVMSKIFVGSELKYWEGLLYFFNESLAFHFLPLASLAYLGLLVAFSKSLKGKQPGAVQLVGLFVLSYTGFIIFSGGDWMAAGRFYVPFLSLMVILVVYSFDSIQLLFGKRYFLLSLMVVLQCLGVVTFSVSESPARSSKSLVSERFPELSDRYSWYELGRYDHVPNAYAVEHLRELIPTIQQQATVDTVNILSGHGGFVPYALRTKYSVGFTWVDKGQLATSDLIECEALSLSKSRSKGVHYTWADFAYDQEELLLDCDFPTPHLLFMARDLSQDGREVLRKAGYRLIYDQRERDFPREDIHRYSFNRLILIKDDLLADVRIKPLE